MADLKPMFGDMSFKNVRTYIQSGNVLFETNKTKNETLAKKIEKFLLKSLGYDVTTVIRTKEEIISVIAGYPFGKIKNHELYKLNVAFLSGNPGKENIKELESLNTVNEMFSVSGNNAYVIYNTAFPLTLIGKNILEKTLKVRATVRNWNTVNKILDV